MFKQIMYKHGKKNKKTKNEENQKAETTEETRDAPYRTDILISFSIIIYKQNARSPDKEPEHVSRGP